VKDGTLPGMSARLNPGQGMSIMDSLLQKAPLFRHSLENKFLLVQSRGLSANWELSLRSLETCCLVGQIEPKKQVPSPWSKDFALLNNECIRHMYLEAKRKWQRESSGDVAEDVEKTLFDEIAESVFQWWPEAKSARAELKGGGQGQQPAKSLSELVCLLDAARRGQERLQRLGIDLLTDDKNVQKALQELEKLEKHRDRSGKRGESDVVFCARWVLGQLFASWSERAGGVHRVGDSAATLRCRASQEVASKLSGGDVSIARALGSNLPLVPILG